MATDVSVWEDVAPLATRELYPEHREILEVQSSILPEVIEHRGYYSLTKTQITHLVQLEVVQPIVLKAESWLGIPIWRPDEGEHGTIIRVFGGDFKMKYVWPTGTRLAIDLHPLCREYLYNTDVAVFLTEGIKKADAVLSAAIREGRPLLTLAANGNYGWRAKVEGSSVASPDLLDIAWEDRHVYVNSDSDYRTNNGVAKGWNECATYLSSKTGGHRTFLVVTPPAGVEKQGADDFLAQGHSLGDLLEHAQTPERALLDTAGERAPLKLKHGIHLIRDAGEKIPHMVAPLIPERSITLVAGHSGVYKTWHMLGLALDGAFGIPWLGHPDLDPEYGPWTTLYVNKEMSGIILGHRLKTLVQNDRYKTIPDWEGIVEERLLFTEEADLDLNNDEQRDRLEDAIVMSGAKMVILDSFSMSWHGDENSASEVGDLYAKLRGIIDRTGCCFVLLHHLLKPPGGKPNKKQEVSHFAIRGSGQLYQQADACIMMDLYVASQSLQAEDEKLVAMYHSKARTSLAIPSWVTKFSSNDGLFQSMDYLCKLSEAKAQAYIDSAGDASKLQEWILEACAAMPAMSAGTGSPGFRSKQLFLMLQQSWNVDGRRPPSDATLHRQIQDLVDKKQIVLVEENKRAGNLYKLADPDQEESVEVAPSDPTVI